MRIIAAVLGVLLYTGLASGAENDLYSEGFWACYGSASGDAVVLVDCFDREIRFQDIRLNQAYRNLRDSLRIAQQEQLLDIQQLWVKYREAKCSFLFAREPGAGAVVDALACELEMIVRRTQELDQLRK